MPELPEIRTIASNMQASLPGRRIAQITVGQPKCLNLPVEDFVTAVVGAEIIKAAAHGKWLTVKLSSGWLLLNLGMGGDVLLTTREELPEKSRLVVDLDDGSCLSIDFQWFGYAHFVRELGDHDMVSRLGPDFMDLSLDQFGSLLSSRRGGIKSFLLNQSNVAGIGNVYVQDPLFRAGIHPMRRIDGLSASEIAGLWQAIRETMQQSIDLGGSQWEKNLFGERGQWGSPYFLVAYREGSPCPSCGATVIKIRTGSTSSYICPGCQPEEVAGRQTGTS